MAKWAHADVLDNGPAYIKANCNKIYVVSAYTNNDTFTTVTANKLAEGTFTPGSGTDFVLAGGTGADRTLTTLAKSGTASNTGTASHFVFVDTTSTGKVLWVTTETSGQQITSGNTVNFPSLVYTAKQPT